MSGKPFVSVRRGTEGVPTENVYAYSVLGDNPSTRSTAVKSLSAWLCTVLDLMETGGVASAETSTLTGVSSAVLTQNCAEWSVTPPSKGPWTSWIGFAARYSLYESKA